MRIGGAGRAARAARGLQTYRRAVIDALQKAGAEVFRTREGPVLVESSGWGVAARYG